MTELKYVSTLCTVFAVQTSLVLMIALITFTLMEVDWEQEAMMSRKLLLAILKGFSVLKHMVYT